MTPGMTTTSILMSVSTPKICMNKSNQCPEGWKDSSGAQGFTTAQHEYPSRGTVAADALLTEKSYCQEPANIQLYR